MSMYGFEVPCGRNQLAAGRRKKVFDIIAPYVMSQDDLDAVAERTQYLRDLWLESMANAARTMLQSKLQVKTKEFMRRFFPSNGLFPTKKHAALIGLPGQCRQTRAYWTGDLVYCVLTCFICIPGV